MPLPHNLFDYCSIRKSNFIEKYLVVKRKISFVYKADILLTKLIIRGVDNMIDVNELLEEAIRETENLNDGEVFLVKDLFKGYVWNRIPRKDRLLLGTLFLNHVSKMNGNLKAIEKTSSNQQRYKKTIDKF